MNSIYLFLAVIGMGVAFFMALLYENKDKDIYAIASICIGFFWVALMVTIGMVV